jgi:NYN domain-containing protein
VAYRTSIFIDFWNFSLQWRNRAYGERIDWTRVPSALLAESERQLQSAGSGDMLHLEETLVYASYDEDDAGRKLKGWLDAFLDKQPRFRVTTRVRRSKARSVYCRSCEHSIEKCPHCEEILRWAPEKGVDTSIVTGLLSLAGERAFDAALLVSSDTDYLPAVESLQARGFKVINATWANHGHELARACWASFELDSIVPDLRQQSAGPRVTPVPDTPEPEEAVVGSDDPCPPVLVPTPASASVQAAAASVQAANGHADAAAGVHAAAPATAPSAN